MSAPVLVLEASRDDRRVRVSVYERSGGTDGTLHCIAIFRSLRGLRKFCLRRAGNRATSRSPLHLLCALCVLCG